MPDTALLKPTQWVSAHADYLYAFARVRIADEEQAKDLVQETFLAALQRADKFEGKSSERTWLTAILKNKIVDVYRKKSTLIPSQITNAANDQNFFDEADGGHWTAEHYPRPFGIDKTTPLETKEFNGILKACMDKLPPLWLGVFTLKHIDDESSETICAELSLTSSNFWVIIHRAKLNLRACLQKNWV